MGSVRGRHEALRRQARPVFVRVRGDAACKLRGRGCMQEKHDCLCPNVHKSPLPRSVNPLPVACFVVRGAATALPSTAAPSSSEIAEMWTRGSASNYSASIPVNVALPGLQVPAATVIRYNSDQCFLTALSSRSMSAFLTRPCTCHVGHVQRNGPLRKLSRLIQNQLLATVLKD